VARNLANPDTNLAGLLSGFDLTLGELDPVASQLGSLTTASSVTVGALASVSGQLADAIAQSPSTETAGIRALRAARPVLTDAARLVHDIRPAAPLLRPATQRLHTALHAGTPVLRRATALADRLNGTLAAVRDLSADPDTRDSLRRLLATLMSAKPLLDYTAPAQIQCNTLGLWTRNVPSTISEGDASGTWFRTVAVLATDELLAADKPSSTLHVNPYPNEAAPGQDGECEAGHETYLPGQQIGHVPGNQGRGTELTSPPPGTPKGP
jgi:hypothetical protein